MRSDRMDRYVGGELSPAEARELAQASLDSPELFDELTDSALAKAAVYSVPLPTAKIVRFPQKAWFVIGGVAAAVVLISLAVVRPGRTGNPHLKPVLTLLTAHGRPVLLASGLQPTPTDKDGAPVFRSPQTSSRAPWAAGSILSVEDGMAAIDLGSLDGLAKGSELLIFRDDQSTEVIGRLQVTTVFRERARGRLIDGQRVRVKARVRVEGPAHLAALLDQVDALYNRGDADAAYRLAEQASGWAEAAQVPPVRQVEFWNQLAVLRMLRADYQGAEAPLNRAAATSPKTDLTYARSLNNLGVLAELRGDRRNAESQYADALGALAGVREPAEQERRAVEGNLDRLRGLH
jgi:hypothetical protein